MLTKKTPVYAELLVQVLLKTKKGDKKYHEVRVPGAFVSVYAVGKNGKRGELVAAQFTDGYKKSTYGIAAFNLPTGNSYIITSDAAGVCGRLKTTFPKAKEVKLYLGEKNKLFRDTPTDVDVHVKDSSNNYISGVQVKIYKNGLLHQQNTTGSTYLTFTLSAPNLYRFTVSCGAPEQWHYIEESDSNRVDFTC